MSFTDIRHFHGFCGIGSGAAGFNDAAPKVGAFAGRMVCIGGFDNDERCIRDFKKMTGVDGTLLDAFSLEQYTTFHGKRPDPGWQEITAADLHRAAGHRRPHIVFLSSPCKGLSGLLSQTLSVTPRYVALNELTLRGVWLMLEAWADDPPELVLFENVPRIATRGRYLLDQIVALLRHYGYAVNETTHDCGEIGWLAQSRKRFLLVARHMKKVPAFLYVPEKRPLRAVGDILGKMQMPGDERSGPMHRVPNLQWKTWLRLAFVRAGSDWRSLNELAVENGYLSDYLLMPDMHHGAYGVQRWDESSGVITGASRVSSGRFSIADVRAFNSREGSGFLGVRKWESWTGAVTANGRPGAGAFSVADIRVDPSGNWNHGQQYGVHEWGKSIGAVTGQQWPNQGRFAVADIRMADNDFHGFRIVKWGGSAGVVTGARAPGSSAQAVADPRHVGPAKHSNEMRITNWGGSACTVSSAHSTGQCLSDPRLPSNAGRHLNMWHVVRWENASKTIGGQQQVGSGAGCVADPRPNWNRYGNNMSVADLETHTRAVIAGGKGVQGGWMSVADPRSGLDGKRAAYLTGGHYGVVPWSSYAGAVSGSASHDNGPWSVADHRMPLATDKLVARIVSLDGTWHRPFTTLELAALQSLFDPEDYLEEAGRRAFMLDGTSDSRHREAIGNCVPRKTAEAIGKVMGETLLLAWSGETFVLNAQPIWVRPIALALTMPGSEA